MRFYATKKNILFLIILMINGYIFLSDSFARDQRISKASREFDKLLLTEIEKMDGVIVSRRGKLNGFFSIDVTFENSNLYDQSKFFDNIKKLGFILDESISTCNVKLFCKEKVGISISGVIKLRIYYDYRMRECKKK